MKLSVAQIMSYNTCLLHIAVYKGWENGFARECNHDHQYYNRLSL